MNLLLNTVAHDRTADINATVPNYWAVNELLNTLARDRDSTIHVHTTYSSSGGGGGGGGGGAGTIGGRSAAPAVAPAGVATLTAAPSALSAAPTAAPVAVLHTVTGPAPGDQPLSRRRQRRRHRQPLRRHARRLGGHPPSGTPGATMTLATIAAVPRARPVVELAVGNSYDPQGTALWHTSRWGQATSTWTGREPYWIDITCYVHDVETFVGRERSTETWEVGTASLTVDNTSGMFDYPPTVTVPGDVDPLLSVSPGRDVRIGVAVDGGAPKWLWYGVLDGMEPGYDPEQGDICAFTCIDAKGDGGRPAIAARSPPPSAPARRPTPASPASSTPPRGRRGGAPSHLVGQRHRHQPRRPRRRHAQRHRRGIRRLRVRRPPGPHHLPCP